MSDERLRALERTWRATGALADEAALLLEHARVGKGTPAQREVAACLGEAFSTLPPVEEGTWRYSRTPRVGLPPWDAWSLELIRLPIEARGRLVLAPAVAAYAVWLRGWDGRGWGRVLGREEWVTDTLWSLEEAVVAGTADVVEGGGLAFDAATEFKRSPGAQAAAAVGHAGQALSAAPIPAAALDAFRQASMAASGASILATLREETVPWALGLRDVVAERVAARVQAGEVGP